jgi:hypothetical protein
MGASIQSICHLFRGETRHRLTFGAHHQPEPCSTRTFIMRRCTAMPKARVHRRPRRRPTRPHPLTRLTAAGQSLPPTWPATSRRSSRTRPRAAIGGPSVPALQTGAGGSRGPSRVPEAVRTLYTAVRVLCRGVCTSFFSLTKHQSSETAKHLTPSVEESHPRTQKSLHSRRVRRGDLRVSLWCRRHPDTVSRHP